MDARKTRGITLLREWLSPMQRAQFDASKSFDVVGCDSGRRYRIHYGRVTNVHEIDDAGQPVTGWCFVPSGHLVAGDVMLAQKLRWRQTSALDAGKRVQIYRRSAHYHFDGLPGGVVKLTDPAKSFRPALPTIELP